MPLFGTVKLQVSLNLP